VGARWARRCREGNAGPAGGRSAEPRASCARRSSHTEERRSKSSVSTVQPTDDSVSPPVWAAGVARRARRRGRLLREAWARCAGAACSPACPTTACSKACFRGQQCVGGECVTECGDGLCAGNENCDTCVADCACVAGQVCIRGQCATQ
jgi:hypothetical protein